jgi:hypothetical protein
MHNYVLRKMVLMHNHEHQNLIGQSVPIHVIHEWVQEVLKKWNITAMHSTEFIGSSNYMNSNWQKTNLNVNGNTVVSIYVEEW